MRIVSFLSILSGLALAAGCSTQRPVAYTSSTPVYGGDVISSGPYGATMVVPGTPRSQIEADRDLENNLRSQLNRYGDLATTTPDVHIYAQNGTVTLSGNVPSQREREMIESLVRNQSGVVAVNDQLQVGPTPTGVTMVVPGTPRSQIEADRDLENNLRSQLNRYGDLATITPDVHIYSQNGTVTLSGNVPSRREREMIESLVRNQSGVVAVNDQLQVGYTPTGVVNAPVRVYTTPPDYVVATAPAIVYSGNLNLTIQASTLADRNLGQRLVDRLRSDAVLTPLSSNISISVSDGRVYLRGTVDTEEQHLSIVSVVQHTYGVTAVYDQLTVR